VYSDSHQGALSVKFCRELPGTRAFVTTPLMPFMSILVQATGVRRSRSRAQYGEEALQADGYRSDQPARFERSKRTCTNATSRRPTALNLLRSCPTPAARTGHAEPEKGAAQDAAIVARPQGSTACSVNALLLARAVRITGVLNCC
jgi:hypothetical protein